STRLCSSRRPDELRTQSARDVSSGRTVHRANPERHPGLRDLGYVEGRTITIEWQWGQDRVDRLPDLAAELVGLKLDVIVAGGTPAARALKNATRTISIVMAMVGDAVGAGLVESLGRPGGNASGLSTQAA